jgi:hypothetical protein
LPLRAKVGIGLGNVPGKERSFKPAPFLTRIVENKSCGFGIEFFFHLIYRLLILLSLIKSSFPFNFFYPGKNIRVSIPNPFFHAKDLIIIQIFLL